MLETIHKGNTVICKIYYILYNIYYILDLIYEKYGVNLDVCKKEYELHKNKHNRQYPLTFGKDFSSTEKIHMLLYLVS